MNRTASTDRVFLLKHSVVAYWWISSQVLMITRSILSRSARCRFVRSKDLYCFQAVGQFLTTQNPCVISGGAQGFEVVDPALPSAAHWQPIHQSIENSDIRTSHGLKERSDLFRKITKALRQVACPKFRETGSFWHWRLVLFTQSLGRTNPRVRVISMKLGSRLGSGQPNPCSVKIWDWVVHPWAQLAGTAQSNCLDHFPRCYLDRGIYMI